MRWPSALGLAFVLALAGTASAQKLGLGADTGTEVGFWAAPGYIYGTAWGLYIPEPRFVLGAGLRVGDKGELPKPSIGGVLRGCLLSRAGRYAIGLGFELEATTATDWRSVGDGPPDTLEADYGESNHQNWLRFGVVVSPCRVTFEPVTLSVVPIRLGTPLSEQAGERIFLGLELMGIEVMF